MSRLSRNFAFLSYLLSLPGALFVLLAQRDDAFAVYHARQSLAIFVAAVVTPLAWGIVAWPLAWIPKIGAILGIMLFALVLAAYIGLLVSWIVGMIYSLKGYVRPVPLVGRWATRRRTPQPTTTPESTTELIERTTTSDA